MSEETFGWMGKAACKICGSYLVKARVGMCLECWIEETRVEQIKKENPRWDLIYYHHDPREDD